MARTAERLTKAKLDSLRTKAQGDANFSSYVADAGQPGLYAWARRAVQANRRKRVDQLIRPSSTLSTLGGNSGDVQSMGVTLSLTVTNQ